MALHCKHVVLPTWNRSDDFVESPYFSHFYSIKSFARQPYEWLHLHEKSVNFVSIFINIGSEFRFLFSIIKSKASSSDFFVTKSMHLFIRQIDWLVFRLKFLSTLFFCLGHIFFSSFKHSHCFALNFLFTNTHTNKSGKFMDVTETIVLDSDSEHEKDTVEMEIEEIIPKNNLTWVNSINFLIHLFCI